MTKHTFTGVVTVERTNRVKTTHPNGAVTYERQVVGKRTARINLQVDVDALILHLGGKAALAKTRKSRLMHGVIVAMMTACEDEGTP